MTFKIKIYTVLWLKGNQTIEMKQNQTFSIGQIQI